MVFKFITRSLGSLFFTLAFLCLFLFIFGNSLIENLDVFEADLKAQLSDSDFLLTHLSKETGLTKTEIQDLCKENPSQDSCQLITHPELALEQLGFPQIKAELQSYQKYTTLLVTPIFILFILSLVFYFIGMVSFYGALFKLSLNAFISALIGYFAFSSLPSFVPKAIQKASLEQEVPAEFQSFLSHSLKSWLEIPLATLNNFFIGLIAVSLILGILFYFLKKK